MRLQLGDNGDAYVRSGLELLEKLTKTALKALTQLGLPTLNVDAIVSHHGRITKHLNDRKPHHVLELEPVLVATLRLALDLEIQKLESIMGAQQEAGILVPSDTDQALTATRKLYEAMAEQLRLVDADV